MDYIDLYYIRIILKMIYYIDGIKFYMISKYLFLSIIQIIFFFFISSDFFNIFFLFVLFIVILYIFFFSFYFLILSNFVGDFGLYLGLRLKTFSIYLFRVELGRIPLWFVVFFLNSILHYLWVINGKSIQN